MIGGVIEVGLTVAADITGISDSDGLTYAYNGTTLETFDFQWLRVEGGVDTVIKSATDSTYLIRATDLGKQLKLRVTFKDDASNDEALTSAASATVARASHLLVSNLGQSATIDLLSSISSTALGPAPTAYAHTAQAFTVGGIGATVTGVRLRLAAWPGHVPTVSIHSDSSGSPGNSLATLAAPANPDRSTDSVEDFTHSGLSLLPNTTYWVVIEASTGSPYLAATASGTEDDSVMGWSIADGTKYKSTQSATYTASTLIRQMAVLGSLDSNAAAIGNLTIEGTLEDGLFARADTSGIRDDNGLTQVSFSYEWIRVDGGNDTTISGATSHTYGIVADDVGKALKVRVSFTDDGGGSESRESDASAAVAAGATTYQVKNLGQIDGEDLEITIGNSVSYWGGSYAQQFTAGAFAAELQSVRLPMGIDSGVTPRVSIYSDLRGAPNASLAELTNPLAIDDSADTVEVFTAANLTLNAGVPYWLVIEKTTTAGTGRIRLRATTSAVEDPGAQQGWSLADSAYRRPSRSITRSWSEEVENTVLKLGLLGVRPANVAAQGAATIHGHPEVNLTLGARTSRSITDANGLTLAQLSFQWIRVDGATEVDIDGATGQQYNVQPADQGKVLKVRVSFRDDAGYPESVISNASAAVAPAERYLLSNNGSQSDFYFISTNGPYSKLAQRFTTGAHDAIVTGLKAEAFAPTGTTVRSSIYSNINGVPGTSLVTFGPSTKHVLRANTKYWLVFERATGTDDITLLGTGSFGADTGGAPNWTIEDGDDMHYYFETTPTWYAYSAFFPGNDVVLRFGLQGENRAPRSANSIVRVQQDVSYVFGVGDFPYTDSDGDAMLGVRITELPATGSGTLKIGNANLSVNTLVTTTQIKSGQFKYEPPTNTVGSFKPGFKFKVTDANNLESNVSWKMRINVREETSCASPLGSLPNKGTVIWSGQVTVRQNPEYVRNNYHGYRANEYGALDDNTFNISGTAYTIVEIVDDRGEDLVPPAPARSYFHFRLSRELLGYPAEAKRLTLYVCDQPLVLKETLWGSDEGTLFWWPRPMGIDWGTDENRTLYLVRDLTPPAMVSATVEGQKLLLSFDEDVLGWSSGILLRWNTALGAEGVVRSPYIAQPVNARTMELTLQSKMYGDDTDLRLAYSGMDEAGGSAFRDVAGNTVANFTGLAVENLSQGERPDTAVLDPILNPLRLLRGAADGDIVRLTFSRPMRRPQLQFDDFLVQADNLIHELESVTVEGLVVTLTLQQAIKAGQAVTFSYTPSSTPLQDSQGNPVPRIRRTALLNETGGGTTTSLTDGKSQTVPGGGDSTTTPGDGKSQTVPSGGDSTTTPGDGKSQTVPGGGDTPTPPGVSPSGTGSGGGADNSARDAGSGGGDVTGSGGGGGGGAPAVVLPSDADFDWNVTRDIDDLARENDTPTDLWSDGETVWVLENASTGPDLVFAYSLENGERQEAQEFPLDSRNRFSHGIWSDGETVWVADAGRDQLFAYALGGGERQTERDIELADDNRNPRGIWSDGETIYVLDSVRAALFTYDLGTGEAVAELALDRLNKSPRGIWSDGLTFWVSDDGAKRIFAYRIEDGELARHEAEEFGFRVLLKAGNGDIRGIWSDGDIIYAVDGSNEHIRSYNLPDAIQVVLTTLSLSGLEIGRFSPHRLEYTTEAPSAVTTTTVTATATQETAAVTIEPSDSIEAEGHQVSLADAESIEITVISEDESRSRSYRVALTRSNRPPMLSQIAPLSLTVGGEAASLTLSEYFTDPDGDDLAYTSEMSNAENVIRVALEDGVATVTPVGAGEATLILTASDGASGVVSITTSIVVAAQVVEEAQPAAEPTIDELRIAARRTADGRIEFALQERAGGGSWGDRRLPRQRFMPADAETDRWLASSALTIETADGERNVRIAARSVADGRIEFALQERGFDDSWDDRRLPRARFYPSDPSVIRWMFSSELTVGG